MSIILSNTKITKLLSYFFSLLSVISFAATAADKPINIFVSIPPQKYLTEQIGRELVSVTSMISVKQNPVTHQPTPKQMTLLSTCNAYFTIGVPYERMWIGKIQDMYKELKIINTNKYADITIQKLSNNTEKNTAHLHIHSDSIDPHIWTSPDKLKSLSITISKALISLDPANHEIYQNNLAELLTKLTDLDNLIYTMLANAKIKHFMVYHPAWGHYAKHYGLEQIAIEKEGKEPGAKALLDIINVANEKKIDKIFIQSQFQQYSVNIVAKAIKATVIIADPLAENITDNILNFTKLLIDNNHV